MDISLSDEFAQEKLRASYALMQVLDPELQVNIIDLGLVYEIHFNKPQTVSVKMTLSTRHCPMGDAIQQGVVHALQQAFPNYDVDIELVWEPEWNFDKISEAGKEQLGLL